MIRSLQIEQLPGVNVLGPVFLLCHPNAHDLFTVDCEVLAEAQALSMFLRQKERLEDGDR